MIGLTYSLDNGVDYSKSILGDVIFTDMSKSFAYHMDDNTTAASQLAAHTVCHHTSSLLSRNSPFFSMEKWRLRGRWGF